MINPPADPRGSMRRVLARLTVRSRDRCAHRRSSRCGPTCRPQVPPVRLQNSGRLANLVRAGMLYLTVQDAIALALENNIDIEVARYNPDPGGVAIGALSSRRSVARSAEQRRPGR